MGVGRRDASKDVRSEAAGSGMGFLDPNAPRLPEFQPPPEQVGTIRFREVTAETGIDFVHRSGNSVEKYFPTANGSGVAMLDYDGDGNLDLYFCSTRELPMDVSSDAVGNRLYRNLGNGRFEDVTEPAGVGVRGFCHGVVVGDFDGDGTPDLYLANLGPNMLFLNNGDGTFRDVSAGSGADLDGWHSGAAVLDYDGDGHLDLYVTRYGRWSEDDAKRFCGDEAKGVRTYCSPLSITPDRHDLLRNRGDGTFEDMTESSGILRLDGRGLGVVAADLNGDTLPDLYVANDLCPNFLFLNRGDGTFEDVTELSGASRSESGFDQAGMGVDAEDITGDGLPELVVTNFRGDYNTLYRNLGDGLFHDVSAWAGIVNDSMPEVGWACALADLDNDGCPDLIVFNGHVDDNLPALGQEVSYAEPSKVWRNLGTGRFQRVNGPGPFFGALHVLRGAAFGDLDNDGDLDIVVNRMDGPPSVLLNESDPGHWVRLELIGAGNRPIVGASVEVHLSDRVIRRLVKGGGSYLSSNDPRILIGLGEADRIDRLVIQWPGGGQSELSEPAIDQHHRVFETLDDRDRVMPRERAE
ncbi:CRTAC1 family protein [Tautonia rosea]|uniref:CRTAC1 family protein n=1 Tax=Tautonia rosea TaxID=2728037 RepID=UPI001475166C|nr:CRTAC1 family protein [Tautonia rosea]